MQWEPIDSPSPRCGRFVSVFLFQFFFVLHKKSPLPHATLTIIYSLGDTSRLHTAFFSTDAQLSTDAELKCDPTATTINKVVWVVSVSQPVTVSLYSSTVVQVVLIVG